MAERKGIVFAHKADNQISNILEYWYKQTGSTRYGRQLTIGLLQSVRLISSFPKIGKNIKGRAARAFVYKHYQIIYVENPEVIVILQVWDTRQDPDELKL